MKFLNPSIPIINIFIFLAILFVLFYHNAMGIGAADEQLTYMQYIDTLGYSRFAIPVLCVVGLILNILAPLGKTRD